MALVICDPVTLIGRKIENSRYVARLSQRQLAEAAGISRCRVQRLETGDPSVKIGDVIAVVAALRRLGCPDPGALL